MKVINSIRLSIKHYITTWFIISFGFSLLFHLGTIRTEAFAAQPTLERIDLRYNRISSIDGGAFNGLNAPKEIFLAGNRLIQLNSDVFEVCFL